MQCWGNKGVCFTLQNFFFYFSFFHTQNIKKKKHCNDIFEPAASGMSQEI